MKKLLGIVTVAVIVAVSAWNFNQSRNESETSDLTLANLEAIAQGRGIFPVCQKTELSSGVKKTIPFCVNGRCEQVEQIPYKLDVNYCSDNPHQ